MKHISFPDISQFRQTIRNVASHAQFVGKDANGDAIYDNTKPLPTLEFEGTVKLHGTNAAIFLDRNTDEIWYQSRENIIEVGKDNAGFATYFSGIKNLRDIFKDINGQVVGIFGEWCGQGIQKGIAISQLSKMFVVFAAQSDGVFLDRDQLAKIKWPDVKVYNIYDYPTYRIIIDFAHPEYAQNTLADITLQVEQECPVGKAFGVSGVGEGVVWKGITPGYTSPGFWFKVKGEKHSVSKVKTLAAVDIEAVKTRDEFVTKVVTEARCLQSLQKLKEAHKPLDRTSMGDFIRWIFNDVVKEESDTARASNLELDKLGGPISNAAKKWFFANELNLDKL